MATKILIFLLLSVLAVQGLKSPLITDYEWKYFDYVWKSPEQKESYIKNGLYEPKKMTAIDSDRSIDGRTFVTVVRAQGVPASVHTVSKIQTPHGPLLRPYPNWSWYEQNDDCSKKITSVYRVAIDRCNRIWILDTGIFGSERICPAQLLAFDLHTDKLILQKTVPDDVAQNKLGKGLLLTPVVETHGPRCHDTTVYMMDLEGTALVLFDGSNFHRIESDLYKGEEDINGVIHIGNESFHVHDGGVLGMALTPTQYPHQERYLFFRPLASLSLFAADTRSLKLNKYNAGAMVRYIEGRDVLPSQATTIAFSREGTLFFGLTKEIAIGCWNMYQPLKPEYIKIAVEDHERLQFASGMKILNRPRYFPMYGEELLVMADRYQKTALGKRNLDEINFRVLRANVRDLISGTICDRPH